MALPSEGKAGCTSASFPLCLMINGFKSEETAWEWEDHLVSAQSEDLQ